VSNYPPNVPSTPNGPTNGYHKSAYEYSTATIDPENDQIAYQFDWDDGSPNKWTALYPSGTTCIQSHTWQIPGVYTISVKARDSNNAESLWSDTLSITMLNQPPSTPTNPTPGNNSDQVSTLQTLSWDCSDPDGNTLTYDIFLGNTSNPPKIISRQASTSFTPSLDSKTMYNWRIIAYDDYGGITPGPLWVFTTKDSGSSSGGGSGSGSVTENIPPVANASLSEHTGLVKSQVQFDGSQSFDEDGYLINWLWNFNDGHTGTGEITTHTFTEKGEYLISLTVTDDASAQSIDTIMVTILTANTPPDIPIITGPVFGTINRPFLFNVTIDDLDNDLLEIAINWGDKTNSSLLDKISDTTIQVNHSWTTAGPYTIQARTSDSYTWSSLSEFMILINTIYFPNFGYILDQNNDGIYDKYLTLKQDELLVLEAASATSYGLDIDGDTEWDYLLDTLSTEVKSYSPSTSVVDHWWILPLLGIIVLIIFIAILLVIKRSGK
jgi:hypothetical protein